MQSLENIMVARTALIMHLEDHEKSCKLHACHERANAVAFLAHAAGIWTPDNIRALIAMLQQYNRNCNGGDCKHVGEGDNGPGSLVKYKPKVTLRTVDQPKNNS